MRRGLVSTLLLCVLILVMTGFAASCGDEVPVRGSTFEGPVTEEWAARHLPDGDWKPAHAHDVAVDDSGSVYITGQCGYPETEEDYITVKYDAGGGEVWSALYDGPGRGSDSAVAVTVDGSGNVYVTGTSSGEHRPEGGTQDYATIKYGADGTELWVARYNGPGDAWDMARAMDLDALGNVYVTGTSFRGGEGVHPCATEYATVKYSADGAQLWAARYHAEIAGADGAAAVAVDASGNVYVTGNSAAYECEEHPEGSLCSIDDYATIKYDTNGNQLWVARYSAPDNGSRASALASDGSGNVYVTGTSSGLEEGADQALVTVKYDSAGREVWVARHGELISGMNEARDMAVDAWGNVYVTGCVAYRAGSDGVDLDWVTLKYDANGHEQWLRHNPSTSEADDCSAADGAYAMALDASGNAYVTGSSLYDEKRLEWTDTDSVTVKYDTNGTQLWVARFNGSGHSSDSTTALALGADGSVYVVGSTPVGDRPGCLTIKYVPA